jgi:septal ring factor EnvC (AmiA/AmiB activator)
MEPQECAENLPELSEQLLAAARARAEVAKSELGSVREALSAATTQAAEVAGQLEEATQQLASTKEALAAAHADARAAAAELASTQEELGTQKRERERGTQTHTHARTHARAHTHCPLLTTHPHARRCGAGGRARGCG